MEPACLCSLEGTVSLGVSPACKGVLPALEKHMPSASSSVAPPLPPHT